MPGEGSGAGAGEGSSAGRGLRLPCPAASRSRCVRQWFWSAPPGLMEAGRYFDFPCGLLFFFYVSEGVVHQVSYPFLLSVFIPADEL